MGPWLDGELPAQRADMVRSHLQGCAACAEEQRQLARLDLAMKTVLRAEAARFETAPFWQDLLRRIGTEHLRRDEGRAQWFLSALRTPSLAWAVPAVIVLLIGAVYFDVLSSMGRIGTPRNSFATVESIDAYGRNVALLREHESKTTVIWIYQNPDSEDEAGGEEVPDKGPAF
jgi:hypothetical protein